MMGVMRAGAYSNGDGMKYSHDQCWHGLRHRMDAFVGDPLPKRTGTETARPQNVMARRGARDIDSGTAENIESLAPQRSRPSTPTTRKQTQRTP